MLPACVAPSWKCSVADSAITLPRSMQQSYYPCTRIPEPHQLLPQLSRLFTGLTENSLNYKHQNNAFADYCEPFSTLTVYRDCQSVTTIDHYPANGQVLNQPASCCIFAISLPMFFLPWHHSHDNLFHFFRTVKLGGGLGTRVEELSNALSQSPPPPLSPNAYQTTLFIWQDHEFSI